MDTNRHPKRNETCVHGVLRAHRYAMPKMITQTLPKEDTKKELLLIKVLSEEMRFKTVLGVGTEGKKCSWKQSTATMLLSFEGGDARNSVTGRRVQRTRRQSCMTQMRQSLHN